MFSSSKEAAMVNVLLPTSSSTSKQHNVVAMMLTQDEWICKQEAIETCLRGNEDENTINLWQLRELALSPGGLLDPSLRKRAWPILTQALQNTNNGVALPETTELVAPSQVDLRVLQLDVKHTVWNVQEHFVAQQLRKNQAAAKEKKKRRVSFAPNLSVEEEVEEKKGDDGPPDTLPSPTSDDDGGDSPTAFAEMGANSPFSFDGSVASVSMSIWSDGSNASSSFSSRRVRWRKAGKQEQTIVSNVVTSCLRTVAPESEYFEDDRFHYFTGLHDLTALIMVNLESPSLSSLVL
jgi:hypothetical protein